MERSVDRVNVPSPQKDTIASSPQNLSALHLAWHSRGFSRFLYGTYAVLSIIFYSIAIYTALNVLMSFLNYGSISIFGTALPICYVLINSIVGYSFMFYRKWLLVAFLSILAFKVFMAVFFFITLHTAILSIGIFITASISLFLFLTRYRLSGRYWEPKMVVPFTTILLLSFLLANFGMLQ